jgi:hypothetical protein
MPLQASVRDMVERMVELDVLFLSFFFGRLIRFLIPLHFPYCICLLSSQGAYARAKGFGTFVLYMPCDDWASEG